MAQSAGLATKLPLTDAKCTNHIEVTLLNLSSESKQVHWFIVSSNLKAHVSLSPGRSGLRSIRSTQL